MRLHHFVVVAAVTGVLLGISGCTPAPVEPTPAPSPTADPTPSASPSATPSPSTDPVAKPACADLLDPETTQRFADFAADGWQEFPDFADRISEQENPLAAFVDAEGTVCQWGYPSSDQAAILAWAPLSGESAADLQTEITGFGYTSEQVADGVQLCTPTGDDAALTEVCYLFRAAEAFYADPRESLPMLVAQVDGL